jgi:hypothetical protein
MEIRSGLVPKWVADRLNGRRDDTAGNGRGKGIAESERANDGSDPPAAVLPAPAATAALNVPVSTSEKDQSMQRSSPGGRPLSPRTVTAALYAPEGTTDENQSEQLSELRGYAERRDWEILEFRERRARAGTRPVYQVVPLLIEKWACHPSL